MIQLKTLDRITFDRNIMAGKACVRGMRIPVSLIINLVANGQSNEDIIADYPDLELEDIRQSLLYAAWLAQDQIYPLEVGKPLEKVG